MAKYYIFDKDEKVPVEVDTETWSKWFEKADRRVAVWTSPDGKVTVSTVFLGLDHNFSGDGKPILWETIIFGGKYKEETHRYSTYTEAINGHEAAIIKVERDYAG